MGSFLGPWISYLKSILHLYTLDLLILYLTILGLWSFDFRLLSFLASVPPPSSTSNHGSGDTLDKLVGIFTAGNFFSR